MRKKEDKEEEWQKALKSILCMNRSWLELWKKEAREENRLTIAEEGGGQEHKKERERQG